MADLQFVGYNPVDPLTGNFSVGAPTAPMAPLSTGQVTAQVNAAQAPQMPSTGGYTGLTGAGGQPAQINPVTGQVMNPGFFQKGGGLEIGLGALQVLGNLWNSFQQIKLAKDQFAFQKNAFNTQLANSEQTYNTALADRAKSRYEGISGGDNGQSDAYIAENSL